MLRFIKYILLKCRLHNLWFKYAKHMIDKDRYIDRIALELEMALYLNKNMIRPDGSTNQMMLHFTNIGEMIVLLGNYVESIITDKPATKVIYAKDLRDLNWYFVDALGFNIEPRESLIIVLKLIERLSELYTTDLKSAHFYNARFKRIHEELTKVLGEI